MNNIIHTPAKNYLLSSHTITFSELSQTSAKAVDALFAELGKLGLQRAGNIEFIYHNFSQDKPFLLEIAMPVTEEKESTSDEFKIVKRNAFRNLNHIHIGSMESMMQAYDGIFAEIGNKGLPYNGEVREVYLKFSGPQAADNVTEIQIGLN
jgi:effector-binding domain-containing protein